MALKRKNQLEQQGGSFKSPIATYQVNTTNPNAYTPPVVIGGGSTSPYMTLYEQYKSSAPAKVTQTVTTTQAAKNPAAASPYMDAGVSAVPTVKPVKTQNGNTGSPVLGGSAAPTTQNPAVQTPAPSSYETAQNGVTAAQKNLDAVVSGKPGDYTSPYDQQIQELYQQIVGRKPFAYDVNRDALYQQYKDSYTRAGQTAMQDTMGQAAGLTGGYGSSYSQNAGQQAYNAYMQSLNDVIPTLEASAYERWLNQGDQLNTQYAMLGEMADEDYAKWADSYNRWLTERDYAQAQLDSAKSDAQYEYEKEQVAQQYADAMKQQDLENAMNLYSMLGYAPDEKTAALLGVTAGKPEVVATGGGGGGISTPEYEELTDAQVKQIISYGSDGNMDGLNAWLTYLQSTGVSPDEINQYAAMYGSAGPNENYTLDTSGLAGTPYANLSAEKLSQLVGQGVLQEVEEGNVIKIVKNNSAAYTYNKGR